MKKILFALLAAVLALSLVSCSLLRNAEPGRLTAEGEADAPASSDVPSSAEGTETAESTDALGDTAVKPVIPAPEPGAPKHIVLDAGHGYTDPGCTTDYLGGKYEREITAEFALELKAALEEKGYVVTLLRDDNRYVTAEEIAAAADAVGLSYKKDSLVEDGRFAAYNRAVWANVLHREKYIDMYLSLHIDSYGDSEDVRGTRLYYCAENDFSAKSDKLCLAMADRLNYYLPEQNTRVYPTNWEDGYAVTKHAQMPSALIELGFATNKQDAENILSPEWRTEFAVAIADAAVQFFS